MEAIPDYAKLWQEIVDERGKRLSHPQSGSEGDYWKSRSHNFSLRVDKRWQSPDSTREFIKTELRSHPGCSLLDIGCGPGNWALWLLEFAQSVSALDSSESMLQTLKENAQNASVSPERLTLIQAVWPQAEVKEHDYVLSSHSCYGARDLPEFIRSMDECARRMCFLLLRSPLPGNVYEKISLRVWGQPHDSPDFPLAYNIMLQMGMHPNVIFEQGGVWQPRCYKSYEDLFLDTKNHFGLTDDRHDAFIAEQIQCSYQKAEDKYFLPRQSCPALIYWSKNKAQPG